MLHEIAFKKNDKTICNLVSIESPWRQLSKSALESALGRLYQKIWSVEHLRVKPFFSHGGAKSLSAFPSLHSAGGLKSSLNNSRCYAEGKRIYCTKLIHDVLIEK